MTRVPVDHDKNLHIINNPKYAELVGQRNAFAFTLSALVLIIYFGFIFLIAYGKAFLGTPLAEGMVSTIGFPIGVFVILTAFILTGLYVRRANTRFDDLNREIIKEAHQ